MRSYLPISAMFAVMALPLKAATYADEAFRPLSFQGDEHPNDCTPAAYSALLTTLARLDLPDRTDAQSLIHLLLCEPATDAAVTTLLAHTAERVHIADQATGESPSSASRRRSRTLVRGWLRTDGAWQTTVTRQTNGILQLSFMSNEACQSSFVLNHRHSGWLVTVANSACD